MLYTALTEPERTRIVNPQYDKIDLKKYAPSDIVSGFKKVQRKDLEDYIDPENGLLDRLGSQGIIGISEINFLHTITPYQSLNGQLLRKIEINIDSISNQFIVALCEDEQDHIAKFIVTAGCKTDSDERLLPRELRQVIDDNMFCLEKLIDTEKRQLVMKLVAAKSIRSIHRDRVLNFKPDEEKAYQLLIIIQRRRYKDFFNFMDCLRKTLQRNVAKVLEAGGVTEFKVQVFQKRSDTRDIAAELIKKLTGYVDETDESELTADQKKIVDDLLAELEENDIYFIGTCAVTEDSDSISLFLQAENDDPNGWLKAIFESRSLENTFDKLFRALLNIPESWPPLVKQVTMGKQSKRHLMNTKTEQITGEFNRFSNFS